LGESYVEEIGIPPLTDEQIEKVCRIAEEAARKYVYSKLQKKHVEFLNICAEVEGTKPVNLEIDVDIELDSSTEHVNPQPVSDTAAKEAFRAAEAYLRKIACHSRK
jgi:hypothetical protein